MSKPATPPDPADRYRPVILEIDDRTHPPEPIVPVPMEERFRDFPTRYILDVLDRGCLIPEARASALAELARRGVPPPPA